MTFISCDDSSHPSDVVNRFTYADLPIPSVGGLQFYIHAIKCQEVLK